MSATATEDSGAGRSSEGALVEWRSSDQVENGTPSTSPPYWDSDDDDDGGPKPSELYGKYTWKIDKFSQINKRELRSNAFDVGGYKWYILIYPQGCDVCNHLSLFLCVANHDKLLPGWSHFAQFTIAVVNKDPKKSKYSDTLHRFWKKEHDWGWKKFMELSKVLEGFIDSDTLIINAQVQVLRERADRPFRCLDCQYRRELVRVYLTNVEQICRRFVEEHRGKFGKLIEDKARWSSFCGFWLTMDQNSRCHMSREKTEGLLKVVVKHFFIEKEVTSTLVMDSLYSGLKAVEGQYKGKKSKGKYVEAEEFPVPIVRMEKDMFVLVDDVLPLLERAAVEPLPPKDEKGPQNRTKDGTLGEEFNRDSIERDERRLTELGRRTIEIFILAHVFSKIEVAYQEAVALKKQEELIREEEAAWLAEIEHRARRGAADKEKKSKKKQGKNKRNNHKNKDKGKDDKAVGIAQEKTEQHIRTVNRKDSLAAESAMVLEESEPVDDVSDISEIVLPDSEDRDMNPVNWDTDNSEVHPPTEASGSEVSGLSSAQNGTEGRSSVIVDDSSSTCSSDSVRLVAISVPQIGNSRCKRNKKSLNRGRKHQNEATPDLADLDGEKPGQPSKAVESPSQAAHQFFQVRVVNGAELLAAKEEKANSLRTAPPKSDLKVDFPIELIVKKPSSGSPRQADRSVNRLNSAENTRKFATQKPTEKLPTQPQVTTDVPSAPSMPVMSRPSSAPLFPGPMPPISVAPTVPKKPVLARSVSAVGRLGPETNASDGLSYVPQSYRNAILGAAVVGSLNCSASSVVNASCSYSQAPAPISSMFSPYAFDRMEPRQIGPSFSFGISNQRDTLPNGPLWETYLNLRSGCASLHNGLQSFDLYGSVPAFGRQSHGLPDEFPHLDIINDLLNDEHGGDQGFNNGPHYLNRHFSFPGDPSRFSPATSTCRFERARGYQDDVFQHPYVPLREMIPSAGLGSFADGPIDGLIPNQWGMAGSDLPFHMRNTDNDGYPYHIPEYRNLTGHTVFRPSDGV